MQLTDLIEDAVVNRSSRHPRATFTGSSPPTPAELAVASVRWERRGLLRRLVRFDPPLASS